MIATAKSHFNPHLPCGRRPALTKTIDIHKAISIHTFLAEGDYSVSFSQSRFRYFNPHLPCGRRPASQAGRPIVPIFQSTPSLRKATPSSISLSNLSVFQSTPSLRKATRRPGTIKNSSCISIHTFLAEGDIIAFFVSSVA